MEKRRGFLSLKTLCEFHPLGVKLARFKIMHTTEESNLGSTDINPPSTSGFNIPIPVT